MTDPHPFFKLIWRINAFIVLAGGVLGIGVLSFASYQLFGEVFGTHRVGAVVNIEQDQAKVEQDWSLGFLSKVHGSQYVMLPLELEQHYQQSYYDKSTSSVRNYLFLNAEDNSEQHWLLETNQYLITHHNVLTEPSDNQHRPSIAILYQVIKVDSNNDKRLSSRDLVTVGLSQLNGAGYKTVLNNIDEIVGQQVVDKNTLLLLYRQNDIVSSVHIDLNNFTIRNQVQLPEPPVMNVPLS
ncbi:hypothetical protein [Candidatus Albibeggiatoa sp. nov. NOAA]|uniref:hypothetical protein n=1 Tax=Candidatus Albibeggiatoa sp. nov. NOAA TaxID=3162724 RepID=UPI0033006D66|nr:hypothetical protein [Thiotrichaceae bacterium]